MCSYGSWNGTDRPVTTEERVSRLESEYGYLVGQAEKKLGELKAMIAEGSDKPDEPTV
jgi:hypothetical protein